jgi:hypothetical protein
MPKAKGKGQTPHEPTTAMRKQVEALAAYGIPQEDICNVVGVSKPTLHKYYRDELDTAIAKANARVAESLFKKATGDGTAAVTAAIFWLKTRAGWKETVVNEHSGPGGGPIQVARVERVIVDPSSNAKD